MPTFWVIFAACWATAFAECFAHFSFDVQATNILHLLWQGEADINMCCNKCEEQLDCNAFHMKGSECILFQLAYPGIPTLSPAEGTTLGVVRFERQPKQAICHPVLVPGTNEKVRKATAPTYTLLTEPFCFDKGGTWKFRVNVSGVSYGECRQHEGRGLSATERNTVCWHKLHCRTLASWERLPSGHAPPSGWCLSDTFQVEQDVAGVFIAMGQEKEACLADGVLKINKYHWTVEKGLQGKQCQQFLYTDCCVDATNTGITFLVLNSFVAMFFNSQLRALATNYDQKKMILTLAACPFVVVMVAVPSWLGGWHTAGIACLPFGIAILYGLFSVCLSWVLPRAKVDNTSKEPKSQTEAANNDGANKVPNADTPDTSTDAKLLKED